MGFTWVNGEGRYDMLLADLPSLPGPATAAGLRRGRLAGAMTPGRRGRHAVPPRGLRAAVMAGRFAQGPARLPVRAGTGRARNPG
jgi:hypothetical protein